MAKEVKKDPSELSVEGDRIDHTYRKDQGGD